MTKLIHNLAFVGALALSSLGVAVAHAAPPPTTQSKPDQVAHKHKADAAKEPAKKPIGTPVARAARQHDAKAKHAATPGAADMNAPKK